MKNDERKVIRVSAEVDALIRSYAEDRDITVTLAAEELIQRGKKHTGRKLVFTGFGGVTGRRAAV